MTDIIIGERVINKLGEVGVIVSFDDKYINVQYTDRLGKLLLNAFGEGYIKYENAELQRNVKKLIAQAKLEEARKAEEKRILERCAEEEQRFPIPNNQSSVSCVKFEKVSVRLDPSTISFGTVSKKHQPLIRSIFAECDNDTKALYDLFDPKMEYPKYTARSRSKYCVAFLCKYLDTYVLRAFSRNDVYRKRKSDGVTVMESDTTEVFRALYVDGKSYYFTKNISYSLGHMNNAISYPKWHISELGSGVMLHKVIRICDCAYLNDYIPENNIEYFQFVKLLLPALYNNKAEIVFKNKLFLATYHINDIVDYLEQFNSKQIDFAARNDLINALPIIKSYGVYDIDILRNMESLMKKSRLGRSTYDVLVYIFTCMNFDCSDLGKRLMNFVKKVEFFDAAIYHDYVNAFWSTQNVTVGDLFDKNYIERHDILMREKKTGYTKEEAEKYERTANELSWIDREENGYFVIIPKSISEFRHEGDAQHNCVFTNRYFNCVINKQSIVVFLRKIKNEPYVTIEFDYETFDIIQARGKYNRQIDSELHKYIADLGKRLNCERLSHE